MPLARRERVPERAGEGSAPTQFVKNEKHYHPVLKPVLKVRHDSERRFPSACKAAFRFFPTQSVHTVALTAKTSVTSDAALRHNDLRVSLA